MKTNLIYLIIIFATIYNTYSLQSNYKIIDSLINQHIEDFKPDIIAENQKCFVIGTNSSELDFLIESKLLDKLSDFTFYKTNEGKCPKLKINAINVLVNYQLIDDDEVLRNVSVEMSAIIEPKDEPLKLIHNKKLNYTDTVPKSAIGELQKSSYNFDKGTLPEEESTFYDNILQPVIFIGTAIITIAILFTVRSS